MKTNCMIETDVKVTIVCVTYNQEEYIRQCLDSLVMQKTNFSYQIFVGEDCSTDNTRAIVKEYADKYSDKIIPFFREKNLGSTENFCDLVDRINTPYFAFCDGDDFWTDENRLQKQYDFMEKNPSYSACFCRASILIEGDWGLESYYRRNSKKSLIWPDCQPTFPTKKEFYTMKDLAIWMPVQAVNVFVRRDLSIERLPDWMHELYLCDAPTICMHVGDKKIKFLKDNMCTYRRTSKGVFFTDSQVEHMIKTRPQYVKYFSHLRELFKERFNSFAVLEMENRLKLEIYNYFNALIKKDNIELIGEFIQENPEASKIALRTYLEFYNDQRRVTGIFKWEGYQMITRNKKVQMFIYPFIKFFIFIKNVTQKIKNRLNKIISKIRKALKTVIGFILYYFNSLIPKKKNRWIFTSFKQKGYFDNSKYLFEYVSDNHPEIEAIWITRDRDVYKQIKSEGRKCLKARSIKGAFTVARAPLVITHHFRVSDYPSTLGFNSRTKVVNLWHGVGFKSMGDDFMEKTTIQGVRYSTDILPAKNDKLLTRAKKRIKKFFVAPGRELFEEYFAMVCPGQERIDMIAKKWSIPEENYIYAGHPRNKPVYEDLLKLSKQQDKKEKTFNVIYAPTFRTTYTLEHNMVNNFIEALPDLEKAMELINGQFTIRMHPNTWRKYGSNLNEKINECAHITIDYEKDIYTTLANYDLLITDYSSLSLDFAMFNKPVLYLIEDYDEFLKEDVGFGVDFLNMTPGDKTENWEITINKIVEIKNSGEKTLQPKYKKILEYYFTSEYNSIDDSKVIVEELKKRLSKSKKKR